MDFSWLLLLVSAAVLVSIVLLAVMCLDCRNKGSIQQTASEEYLPSGFRVIHPAPPSVPDWPTSRSLVSGSISVAQPTPLLNPTIITTPPPDPHLRLPFSNSTKPEHRSYTPTETESNPSYENPEPEKDVDDAADNYIEVLPDNPEESKGVPADIESRASTPSSDHNYVNLDEEDDDDEDDDKLEYQNVVPSHCVPDAMLHLSRSTPGSSAQSSEDEYEDSNYVNQPMGLVNH